MRLFLPDLICTLVTLYGKELDSYIVVSTGPKFIPAMGLSGGVRRLAGWIVIFNLIV